MYAVPSVERHALILTLDDYGEDLRVLELLSSGEIITTGQNFPIGYIDDEQIGVSPDSRFVWCGATSGSGIVGFRQYAITSYGQLTETGRFIESGFNWSVKFTPNGQMLLTDGPIYRAYPDGSVESTANTYVSNLYLSPRGDINLRGGGGSDLYVDQIDYTTFSINSIQFVVLDPSSWGDHAELYDAAYTPDGRYVAIANAGGSPVDVEIYPILDDGSLDTTHIQQFDFGLTWAFCAAVSKDGRYFYVGDANQNCIEIIRQVSPGVYADTGWRVSTGYWPWQMIVSPDGKYLVVNNHSILDVFVIQADGNLVHQFAFPFATVFGKDPRYFQFAYPQAPTKVEQNEWQLYR